MLDSAHSTVRSVLGTPPLNGGFIQINGDVIAEEKSGDYRTVLREMKQLGMDVVVIQFLGVGADNTSPDAPNLLYEEHRVDDPTLVILEEAAALEMKVYLGLVEPAPDECGIPTNGRPGYWTQQKLLAFSNANVKFARRVAALYKDRLAFRGWYITLETWVGGYPFEDKGAWISFYEDVSAECRKLMPSLPVAISPLLPGKSASDPKGYIEANQAQAAKNFFGLLGRAQIQVVMLQDSVGAKPEVWTPETAAPYLAALKAECPRKDMEIWSNVESFQNTPNAKVPRVPCTPKRFLSQIMMTKGFPRVTFEFFHYMNGVVSLEKWGKGEYANLHYMDRMKALHDWYRDTQVKTSNPAPAASPSPGTGR